MLAAEHCPDVLTDGASIPAHELLGIHHSKISLHRTKSGYDTPLQKKRMQWMNG